MKRYFLLSIFLQLIFLLATSGLTNACTYVFLKAKDGSIVSVRSMEFYSDLGAQLQMIPRGTAYASEAPKGARGLQWKSRYGVVAISVLGKKNLLADAANEKGLYVTSLWFEDTLYPDIKPGDAIIDIQNFVAWVAGNFATVEELKEALAKVKVYAPPEESFNQGQVVPLHWPVTDASGNSIVLEYIDGQLKVWDNRENGVLTNDPNLGWHLDNLRFYSNLKAFAFPVPELKDDKWALGSDLKGLPGDYTNASRFVKISALKFFATPPKDADEAVNLGIHLINTVDIPYGPQLWIIGQSKYVQFTPWHSFFDHRNRRFYYRTYENPNLRLIDLQKLDFKEGTPVRTMELYGGTPYIDATAGLTENGKQKTP
jgi:choloylglycine hydrolase